MKDLISSRKFQAMVAAIVVWVAGYAGLDLDPVAVGGTVAIIVGWIIARGIEDTGKGAIREQTRLRGSSASGTIEKN